MTLQPTIPAEYTFMVALRQEGVLALYELARHFGLPAYEVADALIQAAHHQYLEEQEIENAKKKTNGRAGH